MANLLNSYEELLRIELLQGTPIAALTALTGRIGELWVAKTYNGTMATSVNERGFDVVIDTLRTSVKIVTTSSYQLFNPNTFDVVDRVIIVKISAEGVCSTLYDMSAEEARAHCYYYEKKKKIVFPFTKTRRVQREPIAQRVAA